MINMFNFKSISWHKATGKGWFAVISSSLKQRINIQPYDSVFIDDKKYILTSIEYVSGTYLGNQILNVFISGERKI